MSGKLIIVSAPSGAGKTTIVKHLLTDDLDLEFSVSACSRPQRTGEKNGKDYYFLSVDDFKRKIKNEEFVEWEEVYTDHFYGTLKSEVDRILQNNKNVIFDVDVKGGLNIKKIYGDKALAIFIQPPSVETLEKRLRKRNTESTGNLNKRIQKAENELLFANKFDTIIINDMLEVAKKLTTQKVKKFLNPEK